MPRLTSNQRALARLVSAIADVDERTARRAVLLGPDRLRSASVRERCQAAMRDLQGAGEPAAAAQ